LKHKNLSTFLLFPYSELLELKIKFGEELLACQWSVMGWWQRGAKLGRKGGYSLEETGKWSL